jgi:drug/metabolite transporter (DMT)-like permease
MYLFSIVLAILGTVLYHLFQKTTPTDVHPMLALVLTYATSTILSIALIPLFPLSTSFVGMIKKLNWVSIGLGIAIVGVEVGYLLAYRAGWQISLGAIVSNVAVAVLLVPIGILLFREKLTAVNYVGILLCVVGLVMTNWRR